MAAQSRRYVFETITFKQKVIQLPQKSKIEAAKAAFARELNCNIDDLHIFFNGREYNDSELIPEAEPVNKKYPVLYRHVVLAPEAQPPVDPPEFEAGVQMLIEASGCKIDKARAEKLLRDAKYDVGDALEAMVAHASEDIPQDVREKLDAARPQGVTLEAAIELYHGCSDNLEMALDLIRPS
jgi:hypothetical protein